MYTNKQTRELSAWKYYIRRSVKVYKKNNMLRVGKRSWWSLIKENLPSNFADDLGRICEPWVTRIASLLQEYGLGISESLGVPIENVIPSIISAVLKGENDHVCPKNTFKSA